MPIRFRAAGGVLLVAHLLLVAWLTLRPLDVPWVSPANLHPVDGIRADLALGPAAAVHRIGGELLLLAPLGVLLPLTAGRLRTTCAVGSLIRTVAAAALLSLTIALLQTGVPGQVADVDATLLNPLGVALAHLAVVPAARARLRRATAPVTAPAGGKAQPTAPDAGELLFLTSPAPVRQTAPPAPAVTGGRAAP